MFVQDANTISACLASAGLAREGQRNVKIQVNFMVRNWKIEFFFLARTNMWGTILYPVILNPTMVNHHRCNSTDLHYLRVGTKIY